MIRHGLSVDVEDWHQLMARRLTGSWVPPSDAVVYLTETILNLLARRGVLATFFIVGNLAEAKPELVRAIAQAGHEVATHGHSHVRVDHLTPDAFRLEVRRSVAVLQETSGQRILGHRAPEFSINRRSLWALRILAEEGLSYDSSVVPMWSRPPGVTDDGDRRPHRIALSSGSLIEFPLATLEVRGWRLPAAGGGYFRLWPYVITREAIRRLDRKGIPAIVYLHPYDLSGALLSVKTLSRFSLKGLYWIVRHNLGRGRMIRRLEQLLSEFPLTTIRDLVHAI